MGTFVCLFICRHITHLKHQHISSLFLLGFLQSDFSIIGIIGDVIIDSRGSNFKPEEVLTESRNLTHCSQTHTQSQAEHQSILAAVSLLESFL